MDKRWIIIRKSDVIIHVKDKQYNLGNQPIHIGIFFEHIDEKKTRIELLGYYKNLFGLGHKDTLANTLTTFNSNIESICAAET